ncbi:MAG TPA: trigger factor [Spirochaetia bacterium]|nr:trigger factor [Spirochaetia bacterium]HRZ66311.1 trigger factor [Spirochaetia bacterium]
MISSKKVEKLEHSSVKLSVTVPQAEVKASYEATIREYAKSVRIDGFRVGHVPASVLERKFGESLKLDAMGRVMEKAVEEAVKDIEEKPLAYSSPSLEGEPRLELDKDFSFAVVYDVFPQVPAFDWKGLKLALPQVRVEPADEERELAELRDRNAIVVERDSGAKAVKGDVVTVDYRELGPDGQALAGTERSDFTFEVGSGYNLYKFDEDVVGMAAGEEKTVEKSFPADFEYKELAGRSAKVALKLTKIKEKKLPELDDDFAQDVSEKYKTLADLRADLRAQLEKRLDARLRQLKEKAVVEGLLERVSVELPSSMVEAELAMRLENLKRQMGIEDEDKLDRLLSFSGKTRETLAAEWRPSAAKAITTRLVLEKLAEEGKFECSDADLEAEYARQAAEASLSVDEVKAEYEKRGSLEYLRDRIKEDKLMDAIIAEAKVEKGPARSFVDLFKDNE